MGREQANLTLKVILPAVVVLTIVTVATVVIAPGGMREWLALAGVILLVVLALVAAWRHDMLAFRLARQTAELQKQTARLTALHDMAQSLGSPLRLEEVLLQGAERVKTVLGADAAHIYLVGAGQTLQLRTAVGTPISFMAEESTIGMGECVCGLAASSAQPIVVNDLNSDARATRVACKHHGYCTVASVPLRSRNRALGILTVNSRSHHQFTQTDLDMMTALGNQLGTAIENAQLYSEMEQRVQELARQMEHLVIVQERERISREIHDGLAQALALLNMRVNVAQGLLAAGQNEQARKELAEASQVIDAANRDVREAITALRLTSPKGINFCPTLQEFVLDFGARNNLSVDFAMANGTRAVVLAPLVEAQLMRIIQEALTNIRKHARAEHVQVTLARRGARLVVSVQDDGQGFDMDAVLSGQNKKSFGLTTMHERASGIGGFLDVQTQIGSGTRVTISVPCEPEPAPTSPTPIEEETD